jgi:lysophospholipase L1-like esterase
LSLRLTLYGDSLTAGFPGASYARRLAGGLPGWSIRNLGKPGETVRSLESRLRRTGSLPESEVALLWIGVNDLGWRLKKSAPFIKGILGQPWAEGLEDFEGSYRTLLDLIRPRSAQLIAVPPLCIGEDFGGEWNARLEPLREVVTRIARLLPNTSVFDLRPAFAATFGGGPRSDYVPDQLFPILWDGLTLLNDAGIDRRARERGLAFTFDGLHFNTAGAQLAAATLEEAILSRQK